MTRFLMPTVVLAGALAVAIPATAATRLAQNGVVVQLNGTTLTIPSTDYGRATAYLCAAGDVAQTGMNARATDRIELTQVPGDGTYAYEFELVSGSSGAGGGFQVVSIRKTGQSMSVATASSICNDEFQR